MKRLTTGTAWLLIMFSATLAAVPRGIGATGTREGRDHEPAAAPARPFPPLAALYETQTLAEGDQTTAQGHTPLRWYLWRDDRRVETRTMCSAKSGRGIAGEASPRSRFFPTTGRSSTITRAISLPCKAVVVASSAIPYRSPGTRKRLTGSQLTHGTNGLGQGLSRHARRRLDGSALVTIDLASAVDRTA